MIPNHMSHPAGNNYTPFVPMPRYAANRMAFVGRQIQPPLRDPPGAARAPGDSEARKRNRAEKLIRGLEGHSNAMSKLRADSTFCDATITTQDGDLSVHRVVLVAPSSYFRKVFDGPFMEARSRCVDLSEHEAWIVKAIVDSCYNFYYELEDDTLLHHARVYHAAETYFDAPSVADAAFEQIHGSLNAPHQRMEHIDINQIPDFADFVLDNFETDHRLGKLVHHRIPLFAGVLMEHPDTAEQIMENKKLTGLMLQRMAKWTPTTAEGSPDRWTTAGALINEIAPLHEARNSSSSDTAHWMPAPSCPMAGPAPQWSPDYRMSGVGHGPVYI